MQSKTTFRGIKGYLLQSLMVLGLFCFMSSALQAQQYVNGNLATGATTSNGTAAPAGFQWSEVQSGNGTSGVGANIAAGLSIADDFTVTSSSWNVSKITFFAYSTGYAGSSSPFNDVRVQIFDTDPSAGGVSPIFGDLTTNRLLSSSTASLYRIFNATPGTTRQVWKIEANVPVSLNAGTYWVEWQVGLVSGLTSNFTPPSTVVGTTTQSGVNAMQHDLTADTWVNVTDGTSGDAQDFHFLVDYTTPPCTGTPAPGATISSASSVCPNVPFTLSVENASESGLTYQWQSSTDGVNYSDIPGATSATLNTSETATTWYQLVVTCSASSSSSVSSPVQVILSCYCIPASSNCNLNDAILNVTIQDLDNTTTCSTGGYGNYTTSVSPGTLVSGGQNDLSITVGAGGHEYVAVWVDYNQNSEFEPEEYTRVGNATSTSTPMTFDRRTINVPTTATPGLTRMRVRVRYNQQLNDDDACTSYIYGETEDYTVEIRECIPTSVVAQPSDATTICGGSATFAAQVVGDGAAVRWQIRQNSTSPWQNIPQNGNYSQSTLPTLTVSNASVDMNGNQFRLLHSGACSSFDFSDIVTLTVNPITATVNNPAPEICNGSSVALSITNTAAAPTTATFSSGSVNIAIPDNTANGISNSLNVSGIPAGAVITGMSVNFSLNHTYCGDILMNLKAPNGSILNLDKYLTLTANQAGTYPNIGFDNTVISSDGTAELSTANAQPITGTFAPDAVNGAIGGPTTIQDPAGFPSDAASFADLYSTPNGTYTLAVADGGPADEGTLVNWSLNITYVAPTLATGTWSPTTGLFTDAALTTAYNGIDSVNTVYAAPTATTSYSVVVFAGECTSDPLEIPVSVANPAGEFTTQPSSVSICEGGDVTFTTATDNGNPLIYQWEVSTDGGTTYTSVADGGAYSGANTNTLHIAGVTTSISGTKYRLVVSVEACSSSVTSNVADLTVFANSSVSVSSAPFTSLFPGLQTTLTATVSPDPTNATYQWQLNGSDIPGATSSTYTVDVDGMGAYTVKIVDGNTCPASSNNSVTITDSLNTTLFVYPNPSNGTFQVRYYEKNKGISTPLFVNIYDAKGARVFRQSYNINSRFGRMDVDFSNKPKGVYFIDLVDAGGVRLQSERVVVY